MINSDTPENYGQDDKNFQNADTGKQGQQKTTSTGHTFTENAEPDYGNDLSTDDIGNPYDSENLDNESDSESKDITGKDIEEDLRSNDPSEGVETDIDTSGSNEAESDSFKTIEPDQDNPVNKEFEIGELGNEELQEDERARDETDGGAPGNFKRLKEYIEEGISIGELVRRGIVKFDISPGIFEFSLEFEGFETSFLEQFRADFNDDGIEDIFVSGWVRAIHGTMGFGFTEILTRLSQKHLIDKA